MFQTNLRTRIGQVLFAGLLIAGVTVTANASPLTAVKSATKKTGMSIVHVTKKVVEVPVEGGRRLVHAIRSKV